MDRKAAESQVDIKHIEEGSEILIDFEKLKKIATGSESVVPVVVQDAESKEVLIVAYANLKALQYTLESQIATFWSTSRNELWIKGKTSGDQLDLVEVRVNCDQNSLLYLVKMAGKGSCHVKDEKGNTRFGCYYRRIQNGKLEFLA